jgi:hypothetical protein
MASFARILPGLLGLVVLVAASLATSADSPATPSVTLRYSLSVGGAQLGRLVANYQETEQGFKGRSETRAEGMASILLGGDLSETCDFEAVGNKVISRNYVSSKQGRGAYEYATIFDWDARKVHFDNDVTLDMPEGYVVDNCNLPFAAALSRGSMLSEQPLYVVDATRQRIRGYQVSSVTEEMLKTVLGEINTVKVEMIRELRPDRSLTFWLAPRSNYFPVMMVEKRSSRTTTMKLESMEGI